MGHQQKLLYVLGMVVVSAAILTGIKKFITSHQEANINALTVDLLDIAAKIQIYYSTPQYLGGGNHSFSGLTANETGLPKLFIDNQNENGTFKIINPGNDDFLIVQAIGKDDYDGDGTNLTIEMTVYADSVETKVVNY